MVEMTISLLDLTCVHQLKKATVISYLMHGGVKYNLAILSLIYYRWTVFGLFHLLHNNFVCPVQESDYLQECLDVVQQEFVIFNREKYEHPFCHFLLLSVIVSPSFLLVLLTLPSTVAFVFSLYCHIACTGPMGTHLGLTMGAHAGPMRFCSSHSTGPTQETPYFALHSTNWP